MDLKGTLMLIILFI